MNPMTHSEPASAITPKRRRVRGLDRIEIPLRHDLSITVTAADLNIDGVLAAAEMLAGRLRKGKQMGLQLSTIVAMLRDQSEAASQKSRED